MRKHYSHPILEIFHFELIKFKVLNLIYVDIVSSLFLLGIMHKAIYRKLLAS